jgi:multiple sugar transport system permease protein
MDGVIGKMNENTYKVIDKQSKTLSKYQKFKNRHHDALVAIVLVGPLITWWLIISGFPLLTGFILGFFDWVGLNSSPKFVFLNNYIRFFQDSYYYMDLIRSFYIGSLCMAVTIILGLFVAIFLNKNIHGKGFYRTIWYIPAVASGVACTQIFNILLEPSNGVINNTLQNVFNLQPINWQLSTFWGIFWILIYSVWKGIGAISLMWLAGLQSIDSKLYEAAQIDGANKKQLFRYITIPQLRPMTIYILITGFVGAMQIYEQVMFITNGGPYGTTEVLVYRIMRDAFWDYNYGMAGASSVVLMLVTVGFSILVFKKQTMDNKLSYGKER